MDNAKRGAVVSGHLLLSLKTDRLSDEWGWGLETRRIVTIVGALICLGVESVVGIARNVSLPRGCGRMWERHSTDPKVKGRRPDVVRVQHCEMGC
jgi:hypothetical protein